MSKHKDTDYLALADEAEERAVELEAENSTYGQVHDLGSETHAVCLDVQRLASALREQVEENKRLHTMLEAEHGKLIGMNNRRINAETEVARLKSELEKKDEALRKVKRLAPQLHSYAFGQNRYADEVLLQVGETVSAALSPAPEEEE